MQAHLRGRKHQLVSDRVAAAARSIYVRGPSDDVVEEKELSDLFGQFGEVKHAWVDPQKVRSNRGYELQVIIL